MDIIKKNMTLAASGKGRVKNRAPAAVQISAEQLIYDANQRMMEKPTQPAVREVITDVEELAQYRSKRRKVRLEHKPPRANLPLLHDPSTARWPCRRGALG